MKPLPIEEARKRTADTYARMRVSDATTAKINANILAAADRGERTTEATVTEDELEAVRQRYEGEGYAVGRMPGSVFYSRVCLSFRW